MAPSAPPALRRGSRATAVGVTTRLLPLFAVLLPLMMLGVGALVTWRSSFADARRELQHTADLAAGYTASLLSGYVQAAGRVNDILKGLSDEEIRAREAELHARLAALTQDLPQAAAAYVVDAAGYPLVGASVYPVPRDRPVAADRDFFVALSGAEAPQVHVSQVYVGRFDGKLFSAISRPRGGGGNAVPPGSFDGLVNVSLEPAVMERMLQRMRAEPEDVVAVLRADGQILARTTGFTEPPLPLPASSPFRALVSVHGGAASFEARESPGGERHLVAIRAVEGFQVFAWAERARSAVLQAWRDRIASHLIFGLPATAALFVLALRVRAAQHQIVAANLTLREDLMRASARLRRAQDAGGVHPFELDAEGNFFCTEGFPTLFGWPPGSRMDREKFLAAVHPEDRPALVANRARLAVRPTPFAIEFRILLPDGRTRWLLSRGEGLAGVDGRPNRIVGVQLDITDRKTAELALADSEARLRDAQDAGGVGSWEWDLRTGRLRWTDKTFELFGFDPAKPEPHHDAIDARRHPEDRDRVAAAIEAAKTSGVLDIEYRIQRPTTNGTETVWIGTQGRLASGAGGRAGVMLGIHRDIDARKHFEENLELLAREVEHRSKNALAIVQATLRLTKAADHDAYVQTVQGRVDALARAHNLFSRRGTAGADLRSLVEGELTPFLNAGAVSGPRAECSGPAVTLPVWATQPLAMAIHELATNAAKYGALSTPSGLLSIAWTRMGDDLTVEWRESGGPPLACEPERVGFGTMVIDRTVTRQLGGRIKKTWTREGLVCVMHIGLAEDAGPGS